MQEGNLTPVASEARLVALARRGRLDAYNQLVVAYQQLVYNIAFYALADPALAAEVTQEAFAEGFCQLARGRDDGFRELIVRLVAARCRARLTLHRGWRYSTQAMLDQPAVFGGLQVLDRDERITLVLSDVAGLSYAEVAAATGRQWTSVRTRLAHARWQFQAALHGTSRAGQTS